MPNQLVGDNKGLTTFQAAVDALTAYEAQWEDVEVVGARPDEQHWSDGNLHEVVDVTFRIFGRPGLFTVYPEYLPDWVARAEARIAFRRDQINAIYEGLDGVQPLFDPDTGAPRPLQPFVAV